MSESYIQILDLQGPKALQVKNSRGRAPRILCERHFGVFVFELLNLPKLTQ